MDNTSGSLYYEYRIKNGDTFSGIMRRMFGHNTPEIAGHVLALNPQISNPDTIRAGDILRLGVLPASPQPKQPAIKKIAHPRPSQIKPPPFMTQSVHPNDIESFWALAWLEHNAGRIRQPAQPRQYRPDQRRQRSIRKV